MCVRWLACLGLREKDLMCGSVCGIGGIERTNICCVLILYFLF